MLLFLSHDMDDAAFRIRFPSTLEQIQREIAQQDGTGPVQIVGTGSCADRMTNYIRYIDLNNEVNIEKLNQLAALVDGMDERSERVFSGVLYAESINGLDDVLRIASSLEQYEFIEGVTSDKELGGWLVEHGLAGVDFPEQVRPYLDYDGIGAEYCANHGGAYTAEGYIKRREAAQTQAREEKATFVLTLATAAAACRLEFPAAEDALSRAREKLEVGDLNRATVSDVQIDYPWAYLLPLDTVTVEDANTLARCVSAMSDTERWAFGAALEAEEPATFSDAVCIAEDIDCYELVDMTEGEYGRAALRYAGAGDEILDILDGCTDFERLGRALMEEDGVRETSFGQVKRLSAPWPQQAEQGQTMC